MNLKREREKNINKNKQNKKTKYSRFTFITSSVFTIDTPVCCVDVDCRVPVYVDTKVSARIPVPQLMYWSLGNVKTMLKILHPDSIRANKCHVKYKNWPTLKILRVLMQLEIVVPATKRSIQRKNWKKKKIKNQIIKWLVE